MIVLGIDIGGSGIKGAPVDTASGTMLADRERIVTPQPSTPEAVVETVLQLVQHFAWQGPVGCTFPGVIKHGVIHNAANLDSSWIGFDGASLFQQKTGLPVLMLNDADAAGLAEMSGGAGQGNQGVVMLLTFGTGIGSALFIRGILVPNTELGHLELRGKDAEHRAAARIRDEKGLDWEQWGERVDEYLRHVEMLFSPDLFIIGGGVSKKFEKFKPYLHTKAQVVAAAFHNDAGIIGAAMAAADDMKKGAKKR